LTAGLVVADLPTTQYCGGNTPLHSQYFSPYIAEERPAKGCVGSVTPQRRVFMHVIVIRNPDNEVHLQLTGPEDGKTSLILISGRPTVWRVSNSNITFDKIYISHGSSATRINGDFLNNSSTIYEIEENLLTLAKTNNNIITSYTTIDEADRLFLQLPQSLINEKCDLSSKSSSLAVRAYSARLLPSFGCFHSNAAGLLATDVHVIDLKSDRNSVEATKTTTLKRIELNIVPELQDLLTPRNLTVVLKSEVPVLWTVHTQGILGSLTLVTGNNSVDGLAVNGKLRLKIDKTDISDDFNELMKTVTDTFGLPLSYLKVYQANFLEMLIPPRSKREVLLFGERDRSNLLRDTDSAKSHANVFPTSNQDISEMVPRVKAAMSKHCSMSRISVSLPSALVHEFGVWKITLNDPTCVAQDNGTMYTVSSHSTACGSTALTHADSPLYRNNLVLHLDNPRQQVRIPYFCKFKPGIPGITMHEDKEVEEQEDVGDLDNIESSEEMYGIQVNLVQNIEVTPLLRLKTDSAPVALHDELYVQSHINAVRYLALAVEQCWLSTSPRTTSHSRPTDIKLVMAGCPAHNAVTMNWDQSSANAGFSFKITEDMGKAGKVWLQCRMGLCSATSAGAHGNIFRCEDPRKACSSSRPHRESSIQQVTVRGPLHILPVTRNILGQIKPAAEQVVQDNADQDEGDPDKPKHSPPGPLVGVTVEVAVAISLASFLVGAGSTGVLWFIHSKAEKVKTIQLRRGDETELRSVLNNAAGETRCTAAILRRPDNNGNCAAGCPLMG